MIRPAVGATVRGASHRRSPSGQFSQWINSCSRRSNRPDRASAAGYRPGTAAFGLPGRVLPFLEVPRSGSPLRRLLPRVADHHDGRTSAADRGDLVGGGASAAEPGGETRSPELPGKLFHQPDGVRLRPDALSDLSTREHEHPISEPSLLRADLLESLDPLGEDGAALAGCRNLLADFGCQLTCGLDQGLPLPGCFQARPQSNGFLIEFRVARLKFVDLTAK